MRHVIPAIALCLLVSCGGSDSGKQVRTERERDSIIGQSQLPGARGVQRALDVSDSAAARNARLDSIAAEQ